MTVKVLVEEVETDQQEVTVDFMVMMAVIHQVMMLLVVVVLALLVVMVLQMLVTVEMARLQA